MENHPIPQDITGFQFKLIGNMTVKQFAYLAGGVILAWICYVLPISAFIKMPFAFMFIIIGVAFAFLPIEGRPLDVMISHFVKALLNPTQFIYQKTGRPIFLPMPAAIVQQAADQTQANSGLSGENLKQFLDSLPKRPKNKLDEKEMVFFQSLGNAAMPQQVVQATPAFVAPHVMDTVAPPPTPVDMPPAENEPQAEEIELEREAAALKTQLDEAKKLEQTQTGTTNQVQAHQKVTELEQTLQETLGQKQELEKQLMSLKRTLEAQQKQVYKPSIAVAEKEETKNVRSIPKNMGKAVGLPNASEFPNIVSGIVKDPRGNSLSNILVEIKDGENNPVRAFKTNALGQFASATPLTNGTYTIEFEDPKGENKFDIIQFSANGEVILPIEVISVDTREELRRSLFN
jgi:hypothetical protein